MENLKWSWDDFNLYYYYFISLTHCIFNYTYFCKQVSILIDISYTYSNNIVNSYNASWVNAFQIPDFLKWFLEQIDLTQILNSIKDNIWQISAFVSSNLKAFLTSGAGIISSITNVVMNFVLSFHFYFFYIFGKKTNS